MEKINNIIESSIDSSKRFENLEEELLDYQLQYVEKLQEGIIKPLHEKTEVYKETFSDYISEYTNFRQYLTDRYCKIKGNSMYENEEERARFNQWYDSVVNEVILSHDSDVKNYRNNISKIFKNGFDKLTPIPEVDNKYLLNNENEERAGLIHFNTTKAMGEFKDFGINEGDDCISIHFKDLIQQKSKDHTVNNIFSGESLSILALKIIEKYPQTKAIIAESWLIDSAIGERVGFTPSKKIYNVVQDSRFWGQFLDGNGKIKKDEIQKFINTGIPEYYVTDGFIMTKDFLEKYLPKEYKGKTIKLKEIKEDSKKFNKDIQLLSRELNEKWNSSTYDEIFEIITRNNIIASYLKTTNGQDYLRIIKKLKEQNLDRQSIDKLDFKNKDEIKKKFDDFIKNQSTQYIDKEVVIS
jgi:hypothetical protein